MKNLLITLCVLSSFFSQAQIDTLKPIVVKYREEILLPPYYGGRTYYYGDKKYDMGSVHKLENTIAASLDTVAMAYFVNFYDERKASRQMKIWGGLGGLLVGPVIYLTGAIMYQPISIFSPPPKGQAIGLPIAIIGGGMIFVGIYHLIDKGPRQYAVARRHLHQAIESYNNTIRKPISFEVKPYFDSQNVTGLSLALSF